MKVILNVDAISQPLTGIGRYTLELANALKNISSIEQLKLFSNGRWIDHPEQIMTENHWLSLIRNNIPFKRLALAIYGKKRNFSFIKKARNLQDYIFHSPNFILMPFSGPSVATIHDLSFIRHPQSQPSSTIGFLHKHLPITIQQASALITPSNFIKNELLNHYHICADKVHTVPMGVSPNFYPRTESEHQRVIKKYKLPAQFLLSVGTREPRKNLRRLITAHTQLDIKTRTAFPLVITGAKGWLNKKLNRKIHDAIRTGHVTTTGYVEDNDLSALYSAANGVLFVSIYEGFGLPVIESMRSGTPVLTSENSAMSEIADRRAILCNPFNIDSITTGIKQLIEYSNNHEYNQTNAKYAQQFSWNRCAKKTMDVYHYAKNQNTLNKTS